jgi:hypothetical protein
LSDNYYQKILVSDEYKDHIQSLIELSENCTSINDLLTSMNSFQKNCCKGLVFLWYTSELISWQTLGETKTDKLSKTAGTQEEYYAGLIWKTIRAHPIGLSGGYFGHWKYEPEN